MLDLPEDRLGLAGEARSALPESGVDHGVTAVLLSFRAFDTWLEVGVLLLAAVALLVLQRSGDLSFRLRPAQPGAVLLGYTRLIAPLIVLVAAYVLWLGTHAPGGAFQAGALVAAAGILLVLTGLGVLGRLPGSALRALLALGFALFSALAAATLAAGSLLAYRGEAAAALILFLEAAVVLSVALALAAVFVGARPGPREPGR